MEKFVRLALRIVVSGIEDADIQDLFARIKEMMAPVGIFYDFNVAQYPKIPGSSMMRIEFNVPLPFPNGLERIVGLLGGSGWHFGAGLDPDAIWAQGKDIDRPLGDFVFWVQVQLNSFNSLPESRKVPRP